VSCKKAPEHDPKRTSRSGEDGARPIALLTQLLLARVRDNRRQEGGRGGGPFPTEAELRQAPAELIALAVPHAPPEKRWLLVAWWASLIDFWIDGFDEAVARWVKASEKTDKAEPRRRARGRR
jgi:hypothetical protein